jgi:hypothetical protein
VVAIVQCELPKWWWDGAEIRGETAGESQEDTSCGSKDGVRILLALKSWTNSVLRGVGKFGISNWSSAQGNRLHAPSAYNSILPRLSEGSRKHSALDHA